MTVDPGNDREPQSPPAPAEQPGQPPRAPRPNPFAGIPVSDWARDAGALALLLVSLALPWKFGFDNYVGGDPTVGAAGRVEVILITLLSIISLGLTYLFRVGAFPPALTLRRLWLLRLLANVPYAVLVLVYVVIDAFHTQLPTGVGFAAAFGLAGALLAAQPRQAEMGGIDAADPIARTWRRIAMGYAVFAALTFLTAAVLTVITLATSDSGAVLTIMGVIAVIVSAAAVLVPLGGIVRGKPMWLTMAVGLGAIAIGIVIVDLFSGFSISHGGVELLRAGGYPILLLAGLLGLAVAPTLRLTMAASEPLGRWLSVASMTFLYIVVAAALGFVYVLAILIVRGVGSSSTGLSIGDLVVLIAVIVVAMIARSSLRTNPSGSQWPVLGLTGLIVLLGIVDIVLVSVDPAKGLDYGDLAIAFGLPALAAFALTVPGPVREYFAQYGPVRTPQLHAAPVGPAQSAPGAPSGADAPARSLPPRPEPTERVQTEHAQTGPAPVAEEEPVAEEPLTIRFESADPDSAPTSPLPPAPAASSADAGQTRLSEAERQASNPEASATTLYEIAQNHPELWPQLAANPSTYPDLLRWLGQSSDPRVQQALRERGL